MSERIYGLTRLRTWVWGCTFSKIGDRFSNDEGVSKSTIDFYDNMRLAFARLLAGMCRITFSSK